MNNNANYAHPLSDAYVGPSNMDSRQLLAHIKDADRELARLSSTTGRTRQVHFTPSAMRMSSDTMAEIHRIAQDVHRATETVLHRLVNDPPRWLRDHFSAHTQYAGFLRKSTRHWQGFSRYDFLVDDNGIPKFIELNTSCPAGYQYNGHFNRIAKGVYDALNLTTPGSFVVSDDPSQRFARALMQRETEAGIEPGLVAILYDENQLTFELDLIRSGFLQTGRRAEIADASELQWDGCRLLLHGERVSLTYNKFRIGGHGIHRWRDGFQERYQAFLAALSLDAVVSVNNMGAMVFSEDKGILEILADPDRCAELGIDSDVCRYIPRTRRLSRTGKRVEELLEDRGAWVLKPANEGQGMGVILGRSTSMQQWKQALDRGMSQDCIVQEYIPLQTLPVVHARQGSLEVEEMYHSNSIYMINGNAAGFFPRVSRNPVTNIAKTGFMQPVIVENK